METRNRDVRQVTYDMTLDREGTRGQRTGGQGEQRKNSDNASGAPK
jgi:hypothetical protein